VLPARRAAREAGWRVVPAPEVKALLAARGVSPAGSSDRAALGHLRAPLALEAFGPEIGHRSEWCWTQAASSRR
jgi:hypothetical protein